MYVGPPSRLRRNTDNHKNLANSYILILQTGGFGYFVCGPLTTTTEDQRFNNVANYHAQTFEFSSSYLLILQIGGFDVVSGELAVQRIPG
jgi:hypothetical protein